MGEERVEVEDACKGTYAPYSSDISYAVDNSKVVDLDYVMHQNIHELPTVGYVWLNIEDAHAIDIYDFGL